MITEAQDMVKDMFHFEDTYGKYSASAKAIFIKKILEAFSISLNDEVKGNRFYNMNVINTMASYLYEDTINEFLSLSHSDDEMNLKGTSLHSLSLLPLSLSDGFRMVMSKGSEEFCYLNKIKLNAKNTLITKEVFNSKDFQVFFNELKDNYKSLDSDILKEENLVGGNVADLALLMNNLSCLYALEKFCDLKPLKSHTITNENIVLFYYTILKNDNEKYLYNKKEGYQKLYKNIPHIMEYFDQQYNTNSRMVGELLGSDFLAKDTNSLNIKEYLLVLNTIIAYYNKTKDDYLGSYSWPSGLAEHWVSALDKISDISNTDFEELKAIFKEIEDKEIQVDKINLRKFFAKIENGIVFSNINQLKFPQKIIKRL